jgi:hypothetical protein
MFKKKEKKTRFNDHALPSWCNKCIAGKITHHTISSYSIDWNCGCWEKWDIDQLTDEPDMINGASCQNLITTT